MDEVDPMNLRALHLIARALIHEHDETLDRWAEALT
jgi:hypothetical protein